MWFPGTISKMTSDISSLNITTIGIRKTLKESSWWHLVMRTENVGDLVKVDSKTRWGQDPYPTPP